ncbi:AT hook motif protein [Streptomyces sp. NPDC048337]|uniref:AT hook motif protein n=1 Tax=Streptomyces sp. NPDC048337 TaxID=3365535 RepID=UPI0037221827
MRARPGAAPDAAGPDSAPGGRTRPGADSDVAGADPGPEVPGGRRGRAGAQARKQVLLRLDPQVYDALARWAGEELRSANAQIEFLLRRALSEAGRLPTSPSPIPRRGRPPKPTP